MKRLLIILLIFLPFVVWSQVWQDVSLDTETNLNAVEFVDPAHGWIVGDSGTILKFENKSWIPVENDFENYNLHGLHFFDSTHGWIVGDNGLILQYKNDTVIKVPSPTANKLNVIYMINEESGWIGGDDRTILKYSQNSWIEYNTEHFSYDLGNLRYIQFTDSSFGVFIGGEGVYEGASGETILHYNKGNWYEDNNRRNTSFLAGLFIKDEEYIFTTENYDFRGSTWASFIKYNLLTDNYINISDELNSSCSTCDIDFGETNGWAICNTEIFKYENDEFIKYTAYKGNKNSAGKLMHLNSIYAINDTTGWIVGDFGTILKYNSLYSGISEIKKNKTEVYPNPAQGQLTVKSVNPIQQIEIFNAFGTKTESIKTFNQSVIEINSENWNPGIYLIKIFTKNSESAHKVIKE